MLTAEAQRLGRSNGLEEAAQLLLASAIKIIDGKKRVPQVDLHTAYILEKYGNEIRALKLKE